jgi:hypothetical protein
MTAFANPLCRLALRTSSQQCLPSIQNSVITTCNGIHQRLHATPLIQLLTACHIHRRRSQPRKTFAQSQNTIQYP